jgi:hypothetical protein
MGALDEIAKMKSARRAEMAAAEAARRKAIEDTERVSIDRLQAELTRFLAATGCPWLQEYLAAADSIHGANWVGIHFDVPGHRRVSYRFRHIAGDREWLAADEFEPATSNWRAEIETGRYEWFGDLADALIAAEIAGWQPLALQPPTLSAEAEHAARVAWAAMTHWDERDPDAERMAPAVAIDYVQNETGDRDDAVSALHRAAADWLDALRPTEPADLHPSPANNDAAACAANLRSEDYLHADNNRQAVEGYMREVQHEYDMDPEDARADVDGVQLANNWISWCGRARQAIDLCRAVAAAAHPEPSAST